MRSLPTGTILLRKYRVDGLRMRADGLAIYDALDTTRARPVRVHVHEPHVPPNEHGVDVVDVAARDGLVYVVQSTEPKKPPPLPIVDIPILEDDDDEDYERETNRPPPPPPPPPARHPAQWAAEIALAGALTGVAGWSFGKARVAPPRVAVAPVSAEVERARTPVASAEKVAAAPPAVEPSATSKPRPRKRPTVDPLTL